MLDDIDLLIATTNIFKSNKFKLKSRKNDVEQSKKEEGDLPRKSRRGLITNLKQES